MPEGGFLIKFDGKEVVRCYAVSLDYDRWEYKVNSDPARPLPDEVKAVEIIPEFDVEGEDR